MQNNRTEIVCSSYLSMRSFPRAVSTVEPQVWNLNHCCKICTNILTNKANKQEKRRRISQFPIIGAVANNVIICAVQLYKVFGPENMY